MDTSNEVCPNCRKVGHVYLLSTTNKWRWLCENCGVRFNDDKAIMRPYDTR